MKREPTGPICAGNEAGENLLLRRISEITGIRWDWYKRDYLLLRLHGRMDSCGTKTCADYLRYLGRTPGESRALTDAGTC